MTAGIERLGAADPAAGGTPRPFARAVRAGGFVFVSGQVPAKDGEIVAGGIVEQTRQAMENVISVLAEAGCTLHHVVRVGVWLDDPRDFTSFNAVFARYFADCPPARATVQSRLMVDAKVEIDVVAYRPE